jgi:FAD/FMN-containing dehydrogenase
MTRGRGCNIIARAIGRPATEFEFPLHPLGPIVLARLMLFPLDRAEDVIRAWRSYADTCPDEVSSGCVMTAPPEPFVPDDLKGQTVLGMAAMYVGDPNEGAKVVQPLRDLRPAVDLVQPMPYTAFQSMLDPGIPKDHRNYWRGEYLHELSDDAISTFMRHAPALTVAGFPHSQVILFRVGQAVEVVPDDATAFSHRDAQYLLHPIMLWPQPEDDERVIRSTRKLCEAMRPFTTGGVYLNFTPEDRVRDAYGAEKYKRLVAIKDRYDPANLFRLNQNIRPSGA